MTCEECGKPLIPAPARFDGEYTTVGYYPCKCSRAAWLDCECRQHGGTLEEHREFCCDPTAIDKLRGWVSHVFALS